jgi:hypothetical protein
MSYSVWVIVKAATLYWNKKFDTKLKLIEKKKYTKTRLLKKQTKKNINVKLKVTHIETSSLI